MALESPPSTATIQKITGTGHANVIQATGGKCKTIILQAGFVSAGASLSANTDVVLIGVGADPGTSTTFSGFALGPGEQMVLVLDDTGSLYFRAASSDVVFITALK